MKILMPILCLLVVLGVLYGLAFTGILSAQAWADKNPQIAPLLRAAHLAKKTKVKLAKLTPQATAKHPALKLVPPTPAAPPTSAPLLSSLPAAPPAAAPDTHGKLDAIYAAMAPDDLARIFEKLPDPAVIQSLMPMEEKKAGKVLAAMPAIRAARLSRQMMAPPIRTASKPPTAVASLP